MCFVWDGVSSASFPQGENALSLLTFPFFRLPNLYKFRSGNRQNVKAGI